MNMVIIDDVTVLQVIDLQLFRGAVHTGNILEDRRDIDYSNEIAELEPNSSPLITLTKKTRKRTTTTSEFRWFEDGLKPRFDTINNAGGYDSSDSVLKVNSPTNYTRGDLVKVTSTGEVLYVKDIDDSASTITVVRGFGTTSADDIPDKAELLIIGSASGENTLYRDRNLRQPIRKFNYTGIVKTPIELSGTSAAEATRGPNERNRLRHKYGIEHAIDLERMFLYGEPYQDLSGPEPIRTSGGVLHFLTENNIDFGGTPTEAAFQEALENAMRYGSDKKVLFCSARWLTVISQWAHQALQVRPRDKTWGINVVQYISPHGVLDIVRHRLLDGEEYGGYAILLDMDYVSYRPLSGRDTKLRQNIGEPGRDGFLDEYLTEAGYEIRLPEAHAVFTGAL